MKIFTAIAILAGLVSTNARAQYQAVYNAADGSYTIVTDGPLLNYTIESVTSVFLEDIASGPTTHRRILGGLGVSTPDSLIEFASVPVVAGSYNLGNVLPAGMTEAEFFAATESFTPNGNRYVPEPFLPRAEFIRVYVPEPISLTLLGLGGLALMRRRRGIAG